MASPYRPSYSSTPIRPTLVRSASTCVPACLYLARRLDQFERTFEVGVDGARLSAQVVGLRGDGGQVLLRSRGAIEHSRKAVRGPHIMRAHVVEQRRGRIEREHGINGQDFGLDSSASDLAALTADRSASTWRR
jgi:hypothetical protein